MRLRDITEARIVPGVGGKRVVRARPDPTTGFMKRAMRFAPYVIHTREGRITITPKMLWKHAVDALKDHHNVTDTMAAAILNSDLGDTIMAISEGYHTGVAEEDEREYDVDLSRDAIGIGVSRSRGLIRAFIKEHQKRS